MNHFLNYLFSPPTIIAVVLPLLACLVFMVQEMKDWRTSKLFFLLAILTIPFGFGTEHWNSTTDGIGVSFAQVFPLIAAFWEGVGGAGFMDALFILPLAMTCTYFLLIHSPTIMTNKETSGITI